VTICTQGMLCLFDHRAHRDAPVLQDQGAVGRDHWAARREHRAAPKPPLLRDKLDSIVVDSWLWLSTQYRHVSLDEFVLMPNHLHGIIIIENVCTGGSGTALSNTKRKTIGSLIGAFKTVSTKRINEIRDTSGAKVWHRNYYDRIIRNDDELQRILEYIGNTSGTIL
jgi:REP element-mobilizing transposase RayT